MQEGEYSKDISDEYELDESDKDTDIDSDSPNLVQINKKIDKMREREENKLTNKKRKRIQNDTDIMQKEKNENSFTEGI